MQKLIRDSSKVKAALKKTPNNQIITLQDCKIQIPVRFVQKGLAQVGIDTYAYGIYAIILADGTYAVSSVTAMIKLKPNKILTTTIDDVLYYEFYFDAGSVVIDNTVLVKKDTSIYDVLDEFIFSGNIPWYINYEDLGKIFDSAKKYANSNVGQSYEISELLASLVARNPNDRTKYYRTFVEKYTDLITAPQSFVPLKSVFYSVTNTFNKLAGNYFNDGVVSALVNPSTKVERVENLLRM